jgi:hypothetical protein
MRARSFYEFDNASTAPLHGFRDADDYYTRSSSIHFLGSINTPVLCISSEDDPFLPREALHRARRRHRRRSSSASAAVAGTPGSLPGLRHGARIIGPRSGWFSGSRSGPE